METLFLHGPADGKFINISLMANRILIPELPMPRAELVGKCAADDVFEVPTLTHAYNEHSLLDEDGTTVRVFVAEGYGNPIQRMLELLEQSNGEMI